MGLLSRGTFAVFVGRCLKQGGRGGAEGCVRGALWHLPGRWCRAARQDQNGRRAAAAITASPVLAFKSLSLFSQSQVHTAKTKLLTSRQ